MIYKGIFMKTYALKLDDELFSQMSQITAVTKDSIANFIRCAIAQKIATDKQSLSYRLNQLNFASDDESAQILAQLNALSDDDLKIASSDTVIL